MISGALVLILVAVIYLLGIYVALWLSTLDAEKIVRDEERRLDEVTRQIQQLQRERRGRMWPDEEETS